MLANSKTNNDNSLPANLPTDHQKNNNLILIFGNQLRLDLPSLNYYNSEPENSAIIMIEAIAESTLPFTNINKIALFLASMRNFADELASKNYQVHYLKIDNPQYSGEKIVERLAQFLNEKPNFKNLIVVKPGEYRLIADLTELKNKTNLSLTMLEDDSFFCSEAEFASFARDKKKLLLENFYRQMRNKTKILMTGEENGNDKIQPIGGKYNFDKENRNNWQNFKQEGSKILSQKSRPVFKENHHLIEIVKAIETIFFNSRSDSKISNKTSSINHFNKDREQNFTQATSGEANSMKKNSTLGNLQTLKDFNYATTREDAKFALEHFFNNYLAFFGNWQDVMAEEESLFFHSNISAYLNIGLLDPKEICYKAEEYYHLGLAPLNAVEGFIRQILGWREYIRGIYWYFMPKYYENNFFNAQRKLPKCYWQPQATKMNCIKSTVTQSIVSGYSHHIQRLMITGNFALLIEAQPQEVASWYLGIYVDAIEWVELPNVFGMALFADGGTLASKPYISSGSYINKMSNFCGNCHYDVKIKTNEKTNETTNETTLGGTSKNANKNANKNACPFNYLYWNFLIKHEKILRNNHRLAIAYQQITKMDEEQKNLIINSSTEFLADLDQT